jgi:uncharacterized protein YkwD
VLRVVILVLALGTAGAVQAQGRFPCPRDAALAAAAEVLARAPDAPTPAELAVAARDAGSTAPAVHALFVPARGASDRVRDWLSALAERSDAPLRCGLATLGPRRLLLAAQRAADVELDAGALRGALAAGFSRPMLVVRDVHGELHRLAVDEAELARGVALPASTEDGPALVQLLADGPSGPTPVAELVVNGSASELAVRSASSPDPRARVVALRAAERAGTLRDNRLLVAEAERHARDVCAARRVAHELEPGADPTRRLRSRGIDARVVGETVARGLTVADALDALEASPSHLMTLVDRRFTDVGAGTASDAAGRACVVVLLAAWPRFVGR